MFTRIFSSAKRVLSRSPSVPIPPTEPQEATSTTHDLNITMVSTRSGADVTPRSDLRKGKRGLEAGDTPMSSKKRRKSIRLEEKDDKAMDAEEQVEDVEEHPDTEPTQPASTTKEKLPIRRRTNPMVVINTPNSRLGSAKGTPLASPVESQGSPTPPSSKKKGRKQRVSAADVIAATEPDIAPEDPRPTGEIEDSVVLPQESTKAPTTPKSRKRKSQNDGAPNSGTTAMPDSRFPDEIPSSTYESEMAPIPTQEAAAAPSPKIEATTTPKSSQKKSKKTKASPVARKEASVDTEDGLHSSQPAQIISTKAQKEHIRFGSEEPAQAPIPMAVNTAEKQEPQEINEDDDSDSDEAPEEMTTASAIRQAKALDEDALRAQQALQEKERLKRKERADRIKQEQGIKQKKAEKKAAKLAKKLAREAKLDPEEQDLDVDIHNLPALLPESLLEAAGDTRPPTPPPKHPGRTAEQARQEKLSRHIKFLERGEKPIKDVKKGSLNVHVLTQQNMLLAPKVNRDTKNIRERWLKGRQAEKQGIKGRGKLQFRKVERRAVGGGFLRGGD